MTLQTLQSKPRKALQALARKSGVVRWHSLTKAELVRVLHKTGSTKRATARLRAAAKAPKANGRLKTVRRAPAVSRRTPIPASATSTAHRDLCTTGVADHPANGRSNFLEVAVCGPQWLRATWDLTRDSILRAESRLGADWHQASPVIRVFGVSSDDVNSLSDVRLKDVPIEASVDTWYVHISPRFHTYRLHIGYCTGKGAFFALAKSNLVHLPASNARSGNLAAGGGVGRKTNGSEKDGHVGEHAAHDEPSRLGRPLGFSSLSHFGPAATHERQTGEFCFDLATELVVHGTTRPGSTLAVQGEPLELRDDGSFTIRINQPEGRQVVAFTAVSPRGGERRMIVLGVERNTKELERQYFDGGHSEGYTD